MTDQPWGTKSGSGSPAPGVELLAPEPPPPSSHERRLKYLDGWRGLAVFLVLIGHFGEGIDWIASAGVQLFFALSGRLMADILFVERFPLGEFYRRRVSRLLPGLIVFVGGTYLLVRSTPLAFKPLAALSALTFTLNYPLAFGHGVAAIENLWSLCIEEHAYLLLGLVAFLLRKDARARPARALFLVAGLSILDLAVSVIVFGQGGRALWRSDAQLAPIFVSGAMYLVLRKRTLPAWAPLLALAGGLATQFGPDLVLCSAGPLLYALAVTGLDDAPRWWRTALANPVFVRAGLWSYSIYLWQQPFSRLHLAGSLSVAAALALTALAGVASFYLVEQPARRWLNANWGRLRTPAASQVGAEAA